MCGGGSGRETETENWGRSYNNGLERDRERVCVSSPRKDVAFIQTRGLPTSQEETLHHLNSSLDQGELSHLGHGSLRCCAGLKTLFPPPPSTSGCFHVPPVVSHFEPESNGGPRTDLPPEECVLLLTHPTARSFCPPAREVRTDGGEAERGVPGRLAGWLAGWERVGGGFGVRTRPAGLLLGITKEK